MHGHQNIKLPIVSLCMLTVIVHNSYEQDQNIEGISSSSAILWRWVIKALERGHFIVGLGGFQGAVDDDSDLIGCYAMSFGE
jgi:hypothetical protein